MPRILILGGTTEARVLARAAGRRAGLDVTLSLAGRTASPCRTPVPLRSGGFGGAEGLADYLIKERDRCADRRHASLRQSLSRRMPLPPRARPACRSLALRRPPWIAVAGDHWTEVDDAGEAMRALGRRRAVSSPRSAATTSAPFARSAAAFLSDPQRRSGRSAAAAAAGRLTSPAAAPSARVDDRALLAAHDIDIVIAKNSGGAATYGKIAAARALGIGVVMLRRPTPPDARRGRDDRGRDHLARSCAHLGCRARRVDEGRTSGPRDHAGLARADDHQRCHIGRRRVGARRASPSV